MSRPTRSASLARSGGQRILSAEPPCIIAVPTQALMALAIYVMEPDFCPLRVHHGKVGTQRLSIISKIAHSDAEMASPSKQGGRTQRADAGDNPTGYQLFQLDLGA